MKRYREILVKNLPWDIFEKYIDQARIIMNDIEDKGIVLKWLSAME